jgi:N-acetylglucosamine-6-phosphate deacetylase
MAFALAGATVFDGERFHQGQAVLVDGPHIGSMFDDGVVVKGVEIIDLKGGILAPGFVDVQVNGGGGFLLNQEPTLETVRGIADAHRKFGVTGMLPTVITDAPSVMKAAILAVQDAREQGTASVLGIHIEGPFIDPARKGAHDSQFIRPMTSDDVRQIVSIDCGSVMLTLAPNRVSPAMVRQLTDAGVLLSLGHSDASYEEAWAAVCAGAKSFTHLFNAMSQMTGREPGMVGAALVRSHAYVGVIADGHHVHRASMDAAICARSKDFLMLVSDAMPPAAGGPDQFELQGRRVTRRGDRLQLDDGTFAGSNLTMDQAVRNVVEWYDIGLEAALQMASRNPARFLGRKDLGVITPDALASLVHLDDDLNVLQTWVEGK